MHPTIALLGPPGSGKGTQADRLHDDLGFAVFATGDLLRAARADDTKLGRRAAQYMDRGELVPDELIMAMMREAIARADGLPVVLDGFPRTVAQAEALGPVLAENRRELTAVLLIDVPDDVVADRISGRRQGRSDDDPATVHERLRVYHAETEPLVRYYDERGLLRRVDGTGSADAVYERVRRTVASMSRAVRGS